MGSVWLSLRAELRRRRLRTLAGQADVPVPLVLLAIPAALLLASLIAAAPGWAAARIRPALILHSE